jgi:6-phosphogluconate dehydrogenase
MIGGDAVAVRRLDPIFASLAPGIETAPRTPGREKASGTAEHGYLHCGPAGAGHFVKMVHNGIEYADMQLIAEVYDLMRQVLGLSAGEIAAVFEEWNHGRLNSFLVELTAAVLEVRDEETGQPLVDLVLDRAGHKGTGKWTVMAALDLGVPVPAIYAALYTRQLSARKEERIMAAKELGGPRPTARGEKAEVIPLLEAALYAAKVCSYAQGLDLIQAASREYGWRIDLREIARIWKGGCIIRARLLDTIMKAYQAQPGLPNLLLAEDLKESLRSEQRPWRAGLALAHDQGLPVPVLSACLAYYDSYRAECLPLNLTQAQRDAFGAHTYERLDHPERGPLHSDWLTLGGRKKG